MSCSRRMSSSVKRRYPFWGSLGSGGISPLFSFRSSVREEIPRRRQASFMVKYPFAVEVRLFMTKVFLTIL